MNNSLTPSTEKEILRVALDKQATQSFVKMATHLKSENPHVRVQPSAFVSFLVSDYFATYFEKDLGLLVAEFFDSKSYHEAQIQLAKAGNDFEEVMAESLETIKRIKSQAQRKPVRQRRSRHTFPTEGGA